MLAAVGIVEWGIFGSVTAGLLAGCIIGLLVLGLVAVPGEQSLQIRQALFPDIGRKVVSGS